MQVGLPYDLVHLQEIKLFAIDFLWEQHSMYNIISLQGHHME